MPPWVYGIMVLAHRTPYQEFPKLSSYNSAHADNDGDNRLRSGDYANIAGVNSACPIHVPINGDSFEQQDPEQTLISKERWAIVAQVVQANPKTRPYFDWAIDHFSGYTFSEIAGRHGVTKNEAQYRIQTVLDLLKNKIQGHQF